MKDLLQHVHASRFPYPDRLIHLFVGGSELHGAKVQGTDDLDIYGVYIEPPELALGLDSLPHFVWSTAEDSRRNGPDDVDVTLYSLRKWAGMACKGNPTALHFLFATNDVNSSVWSDVLASRHLFLARSSAKQFVGFAEDQLRRITGEKSRGKKGHRLEFEDQFGYDVKAAMHGLRLLYECVELMSSGEISMPRPERDLLIRVRTGQYPQDEVIAMASVLMKKCLQAAEESKLNETVELAPISKLVAASYRKAWELTAES